MPRQQTRKQLLNFVGGLNTESSPLLYPEGTAKDLDNVDLNRDGSLQRRKGMDFELGGTYSTPTFSESDLQNYAVSLHEWESVDGNDTLNFAVVQIGGTLYFHNLGQDSLSSGIKGSLSLSAIQTKTDYEQYTVSTASGSGKLFVVSPAISPAYIQYDADADTFSGVKITLKIRDTDGIEEDLTDPTVFGDDITPDLGVDPEQDTNDTITPVPNPLDFADYIDINPGGLF